MDSMEPKKLGILFVIAGILFFLSILIYPHLMSKIEKTVPVLKSFSDSGASENTTADTYEIWEAAPEKTTAEISLPSDDLQTETVSAVKFPIDINAATVEELMQIKNIGKVIAENIVSYRENYGYFYSVEDLLNVERIGEKNLEYIRNYIYISEELLPETTAVVQETVQTAQTSAVAVTTVPTSNLPSPKQTSVRTKVTTAETEDTDDDGGRIIEEITDFEDVSKGDEQDFSATKKTTDGSFSYGETTTTEKYRPNFPLELNTASAKDLACIDGIGDTIAQRIVEYARSHGFYDVNDLLNVSGIGQSKLNNILPYVYVDTSGLPPRAETTASDFYSDIFGTSDMFQTETTAPEIYMVNVNTASKADFMQLPGIDEALADSIISLRNQIGGFQTIEELSLADGMTNSRLSAIWNYIYV